MSDILTIKGHVQLYSRPASGLPPEQGDWRLEYETDNLIVTSGKELVARMLADESGWDHGLTYVEVGTGSTAAAVGDTDLETATAREPVTAIRAGNVVQFRGFYPAPDISVHVREVGLFGHSTATATLGTGELFNRAIVSFDNSSGARDLTLAISIAVG